MSAAPAPPAPFLIRALLLAGVWLIYLVFGLTAASLAPLVPPIAAELGVGNGAMGLILGAWPLTYIAAALPGGAMLDRIGARWGLLIAVAVMAASAFLRGVVDTPLQLALAVALFGVGGPLISVGAPKLIAQLYAGRARGTAMGIYVTGPYLGGILALSLTNSVFLPLAGGDWRGVMALHGGLILAAGLVWVVIATLPAARPLTGPAGKSGKFDPAAFRDVVRSREVQTILAVAIGIFAVNHALNNWLPTVLQARGLSAAAAGYWAAIPTAVGILGALTVPRFATPDRQVGIMAGLFVSMLCATLLLQLVPGPLLVAGLVLQGIARGTMMTVAIMLLMESRDVPKERLGLAGGLFFTTAEIGGVMGPAAFGLVSDLSGGFVVPLVLLSVLCALMLALVGQLARLRPRLAAAG
ncbi:CynX/NimT family MFS transporter [Ruixingdingia sedimenti]|uniref:MFS transporter n=1 Tax=Ruixingdingia sedimenti TaxID=3073604 RepID=A0ABU1F9B3_9RHOB|nr:MFS transporter [Xinfangfangia sp. LG-4]MDR5653437.1 MFS transporter [Xinfangfangia sp. LG-4]